MNNATQLLTSQQVRVRMQACREELAALKRLLRIMEAAEAAEVTRQKRRQLEHRAGNNRHPLTVGRTATMSSLPGSVTWSGGRWKSEYYCTRSIQIGGMMSAFKILERNDSPATQSKLSRDEVRAKLAEGLAMIQQSKDLARKIREVAQVIGENEGGKTYNINGLLVKVCRGNGERGYWGFTILSDVEKL